MEWALIRDAWKSAQFYWIIACVVVCGLLYALAKILPYGPRRMLRRARQRWNVERFWG